MRAVLRLLGLIMLAGAFAAAAIDVTRSFDAGHIEVLSVGETAARVSPDAIARLRGVVQPRVALLWDPVAVTVLKLSNTLLLGLLGVLLLLVGRPSPPLIGHSRR